MLASLTSHEVKILYSEPGLEDYCAKEITVRLPDGEERKAQCFVLPNVPAISEHNPEYAARLRALAERLKFPREYVVSIM
jgi:hypothetical protein